MLNTTNRQQGSNEDRETSQPLLAQGHERVQDDPVIFSVEDDDDDDEEHSVLRDDIAFSDQHRRHQSKRSVRFQDEVRVMGPPLRSTMQSRETGMTDFALATLFKI